eukprot:7820926-Pyramimonas_sp.AAC.1
MAYMAVACGKKGDVQGALARLKEKSGSDAYNGIFRACFDDKAWKILSNAIEEEVAKPASPTSIINAAVGMVSEFASASIIDANKRTELDMALTNAAMAYYASDARKVLGKDMKKMLTTLVLLGDEGISSLEKLATEGWSILTDTACKVARGQGGDDVMKVHTELDRRCAAAKDVLLRFDVDLAELCKEKDE